MDNLNIINAAVKCDRSITEWRQIFRFSNRSRGAHISGYKLNQDVVYIPDYIKNMTIEGIEKDAFPETVAIYCSPYVFDKIKNQTVRLNSIMFYIEHRQDYSDEEISFYESYINKHREDVLTALIKSERELGLKLFLMRFQGTRIKITEKALAISKQLSISSVNAVILECSKILNPKGAKESFKL